MSALNRDKSKLSFMDRTVEAGSSAPPSQAAAWGFRPEASVRLPVRTSPRRCLVEVRVGRGIETVIFGQTWRAGRFSTPPATMLAVPEASWLRPLWLPTESRLISPAPAKTPTCSPFPGCGH